MFSPFTFVRQRRSLPHIYILSHRHWNTYANTRTHTHIYVHPKTHVHRHKYIHLWISALCPPPRWRGSYYFKLGVFWSSSKTPICRLLIILDHAHSYCQYTKNYWRGGVNRAVVIPFKSADRHSLLFWCLCATS